MFEGLLSVKYLTSKNCFCYLSANNFKYLQNNCLKLVYNNDETCYVTVDPISGLIDDHSLGISSLYARALGIEDKSLVAVSEIVRPGTVQSATIMAFNESDHCVLEALAENVQSTLLEQIRVLSNGQNFIIWIGQALHVRVSVCDVIPVSPGSIDNFTEIVIKSPEKQPHKDLISKLSRQDSVPNFLKDCPKKEKLILRVAPINSFADAIGQLCNDLNVFATRKCTELENTKENPRYFKVTLLNVDCDKSAYVRLFNFEDVTPSITLNRICLENVFVSDTLLDYFGCVPGCRLLLEPLHFFPAVQEIEICTKKNYSIDLVKIFQQYLADNCKHGDFVLSSNVVIDLNKFKCFVRFQPCSAKFCVVTSEFVRNCKLIVVYESISQNESSESSDFNMGKYNLNICNYREIIDKCLFLFAYNTRIYRKMDNVLITGKAGTGKSSLLKIVSKTVASSPYFLSTKIINCKSIKGKTVESLHKFISSIFFDLIHRQPSVLLLDDLQVLCENVNEGDTLAQNAVYFNRVSEMLEELFRKFGEHNAIGILATTDSTSTLNKNIYATRGNHLFKNVYHIKQLDKLDRKRLLEFLFVDHDIRDVDFDVLAQKTESFTMRDVLDLAHKAVFESFQEDHNQTVMTIKQEYCDKALEAVSEISLAGINLHPAGDKDLKDIGGLEQVKKVLVETMLWPSKYLNLFMNAPLRLPSGLLLYGPPGTGKTIVAAAAAKHCGLRLISIKGPELLSKYIGASEQAVRDVFQRAQSAKPCVLFFDEFDSLAPRRGHDNTGVTDRVVNQLLTQLDGIETLAGVFVLAATSRPDLLDPALLRPGRLDIHIRCTLPDKTSRLEILKVLSKNLKLSNDVDLSEVSDSTDGFSGADLQAVLYTAQLDSVKDLLSNKASGVESQGEIHRDQLMEAVKKTRPSLTKAEQVKYERIYERFEGRGDGEFVTGSRATLA